MEKRGRKERNYLWSERTRHNGVRTGSAEGEKSDFIRGSVEICAIGGYPSAILFNFLQLVIT
jgi:hypothetical protein